MNWTKLTSAYINRHQYFTARRDSCRKPDGGIVDPYFVVELPVSVCAMALTEEGDVILTRQYRHPIGETILELPGGFIDENELPEQAIARELLEETGHRFTTFTWLGKVAANPGVLDNFTHLFLATGGKKTDTQKLDANEDIEIVLRPLNEVQQMLERNEIVQALHVCCLSYGFTALQHDPGRPSF